MPAQRIVNVGGHAIGYTSEDNETLVHLGWFFGVRLDNAGPPELVVNVGSPVLVSEGLGPSARDGGPIEQWRRADQLLLRHELGPCARVTDADFDIEPVAHVEQGWRALRQLLFCGLAWWFERRGIVLVHGAMIARGQEAALVLGDTGSGKSTAATAALSAGWDLCSDDLVLARAHGPSVSLFGLPKRAAVEGELVRQLGLPIEEFHNDERGRAMLPDSAIATGWRRLRLLLIVGHDDGVGTIERVNHSEALEAVFASYLESDQPDVVRRQLRCLSNMAGAPTFRLLHSAERSERLARAAHLLETAWHQSAAVNAQ